MSKIEVNQISSQCGSTLTIGQSGDTVTLACGASQTGFGRTGTVDWDTTAKTTNFTAVSGVGYFVNTTSGAITVTLPAGSAGSIVSLKDYANTWNTNNVTVTPNGTDKINGSNGNATLSTQDQSVTLVYVDSTKGWRAVQDSTSDVSGAAFVTATGGTISTCGDFKVHAFTGPGTFTVTCAGNAAGSNSVDYLVVAGGGGAGCAAGGGGAGGLRIASCFSISAQAYPITVGGGGAGGSGGKGFNGSNSVFSTITSTGGGGGGGQSQAANTGGSGGGGDRDSTPTAGIGAAGNTPPVSPPQGNPGGNGQNEPVGFTGAGGGGGGAGAAGGNGCSSGSPGPGVGTAIGGDGGNGINVSPTFGTAPQPFYIADVPDTGPTAAGIFAGGGGGRADCRGASFTPGKGGDGGGGDANPGPAPSAGNNGVTNSGGGGGGGACAPEGSGGSGIVLIRYKYQ